MKRDLSANSHNKPCWAPTQLAMCYLTLGNVFYARKMCVHLPYSSIKDALCSSECLQWLDLNGSSGKMILLLFPLFGIDSQLRQAVEREYLVIGSLLVCVTRISKHSVRKEKYQPYIWLWWQDATLLWLDVLNSWGCLSLYRQCSWDS